MERISGAIVIIIIESGQSPSFTAAQSNRYFMPRLHDKEFNQNGHKMIIKQSKLLQSKFISTLLQYYTHMWEQVMTYTMILRKPGTGIS